MENNDLHEYSQQVVPSKQGPVLHVGAHFPYSKHRWEPLSEQENKELRIDVKKELRKLGYKAKIRSFKNPYSGEKDINDFRIQVLLEVGKDIDELAYEKIKLGRRKLRRAKKQHAQRERLSDQL